MKQCLYESAPNDFFCQVWQDEKNRYLKFSEIGIQSEINLEEKHKLKLSYLQQMVKAVAFSPKPKKILLLGLGGGSLIHYFQYYYPQTYISVIERERLVLECAVKFFEVKPEKTKLNIKIDDAFNYIKNCTEKFDVIFVDIFGLNQSISPEAKKFYIGCKKCLTINGTLVANNLCNNEPIVKKVMSCSAEMFKDKNIIVPLKNHLNLITIGTLNKKFDKITHRLCNKKKLNIEHNSYKYGLVAEFS